MSDLYSVTSINGSADIYVLGPDGNVFADVGIMRLCGSADEANALTLQNVQNAKRISACLNACAGIPDLALKPGILAEAGMEAQQLIRKVEHFQQLAEHRGRSIDNLLNTQGSMSTLNDQLLAALEQTVSAWEKGKDVFGGIQIARAAIAAAKGGAA